MNQPTAAPTNKVVAAGVTGAVVTVLLAVADTLTTADFGGAWWGGAVATLGAFVGAYLRKNRTV